MFRKSYRRVKVSREQLRQVFKHHDRDGDGRLSIQELSEAFGYLGSFLPSIRARLALCYADSDGDGFIAEREFEMLLNYADKCKYAIV